MSKLKQCPSDPCMDSDNSVEISAFDCHDTELFFVECPMCGLRAPWSECKKDAVDLWNGLLLIDPDKLGFSTEDRTDSFV